jgi:hypothetical protein
LTKEKTVADMISYVINPAPPDADDLRKFRYPYMSCEVFCSEVPAILQLLVESHRGAYFDRLLSVLDSEPPLDNYHAGYLEKILDMLFRQMTLPVMVYLNRHGVALFQKFLRHVDNYSMMQVLQRLLLPHIPFSAETSDTSKMTVDEISNSCCDWSDLPEAASLIINKLVEPGAPAAIPSHVSDLLITVIQLAPPDAPFLSNICSESCLQTLVACIPIDPEDTSGSSVARSLAVVSLLESLASRMCETFEPVSSMIAARAAGNAEALKEVNNDPNDSGMSDELLLQIQSFLRHNLDLLSKTIAPMLPAIGEMLRAHFVDAKAAIDSAGDDVPKNFIISQSKYPFPRLGPHGFRLVKLVEAIVRIANPGIDEALVVNGIIEACVKLMFQYELHSLLHLAVQRIAVMTIEGGESRRSIQRSLLVNSDFMPLMMQYIRLATGSETSGDPEVIEWRGNKNRFASSGRAVTGHLVQIAQVLSSTLHSETPEGIAESAAAAELDDSAISGNDSTRAQADTAGEVGETLTWHDVAGTSRLSQPVLPTSVPALPLRSLIDEAQLGDEWNKFVDTDLRAILDVQLTRQGVPIIEAGPPEGSSLEHQTDLSEALKALSAGLDPNASGGADRYGSQDFVVVHRDGSDDEDDDDEVQKMHNAHKAFDAHQRHYHAGTGMGANMIGSHAYPVHYSRDLTNYDDDSDDEEGAGGWASVHYDGDHGLVDEFKKRVDLKDIFGDEGSNNVDIFGATAINASPDVFGDFFNQSPASPMSPFSGGSSVGSDSVSPMSPAQPTDFFASFGSESANSFSPPANQDFFSFAAFPATVGGSASAEGTGSAGAEDLFGTSPFQPTGGSSSIQQGASD